MLLLHHPLQAAFALRVQHLPPVQAVRDDYPAPYSKRSPAPPG
ncbi:rhsH core with extension domain protein [Escherichia coli 2788150]|nr:rhsH core with extension domain protein [Escherichia coli 2788150]